MDTHRAAAGRTTPPLPNSLPGPARSPATPGIPVPGQSCRGLSISSGRACPGSPIPPGRDPVPKDLGDVRWGEKGPRAGRQQHPSPASPPGVCAHLFSTLRILWRMPAREEADRLPLPSAGRFSMVVTTWFGGAGGGGGCSWGCGGSGGIIAAEAAAAGSQNAAPHIVRGLRAREHADEPAEQPGPGRRCRLPSDEAGRDPRLRPPSPSALLSGLPPSPGFTPSLLRARRRLLPGLFPSRDPSPGTPRQVAAKGVGGDPGLPAPLRGPCGERNGAVEYPLLPGAWGLSWP